MRHEITKEFLEGQYVVNQRSMPDIAKEIGCATGTVQNYMKKYGIPARPCGSPTRHGDLSGKKIGEWEVLSRDQTVRGTVIYACRCSCGSIKKVRQTHLLKGRSKKCLRCTFKKAYKHSLWKGHGEISGRKWREIVTNSTRKGTRLSRISGFSVTIQFAWELFLKQERKCALTGMSIRFQTDHKDKDATASLDRISPEKGYTEDNIQWVHKDVNRMKNSYFQEYFIRVCRMVAKKFPEPKAW